MELVDFSNARASAIVYLCSEVNQNLPETIFTSIHMSDLGILGGPTNFRPLSLHGQREKQGMSKGVDVGHCVLIAPSTVIPLSLSLQQQLSNPSSGGPVPGH